MAKVFLSYSREDRHVADRIARDLTDAGIEVWYDANLGIGDNWPEVIFQNLQSAAAVILLLSPASIASEIVKAEWEYALRHSARILPVRIPWTGFFADVPEELKNLQYLNLGENYELALAHLVAEIRRLAGSSEPPPSEVLDVDKIIDTVTKKSMNALAYRDSSAIIKYKRAQWMTSCCLSYVHSTLAWILLMKKLRQQLPRLGCAPKG